MRETTLEEYKRLVEGQAQALLDAVQSVALGNLDVKIEVPPEGEGVEMLFDLAIGLEMMVDDLREMMAERVQTQLVEEQSRALLDVVQSVALGDLDVAVEVPEGIEVLSELAIGIEIMVDDLRETLTEQERARAEAEEARQQLEAALEEVLAVQRRYLRQEWEDYTTAAEASRGYILSESAEGPTAEAWLPAMTAAAQQVDTVVVSDEQGISTLAVPVHVYGELIGVLGFSREEATPWNDDDVAAVETVVDQMAQALESQRLFDEAQQASYLMGLRVKELDCLNDIGRKIDEAPPISEFLQWVAERIPSAMRYPDVCVAAVEFEDQVYGTPEAVNLSRQIVQGLRIGGKQVGQVYVSYTEEHDFLDEESALLGDIVRRVGGYIESRRLFQEASSRAERLAVINRIASAAGAPLDLDDLMDTLYQEIAAVFQPDASFIALYDEEADELDFLLQMDEGLRAPPVRRPLTVGLTSLVVEKKKPLIIRDYEQEREQKNLPAQPVFGTGKPAVSWLGVPMLVGERLIGVLNVQSYRPHVWDEEDEQLLFTIADQVAVALENAYLFEQAQQATFQLSQRVHALDCLNDIGRKIDEVPPILEFLQWVAERIPPAMQYPDVCVAAVEFEDQVYGSPEAVNLPYQIVQGLRISGEQVGRVYIAYTEEHDFLDEESALLGDIVRRVNGYVEGRRLFEEARDRARREQILREITARVRGVTDTDAIVRVAVRQLGTALGRPTFVRLGSVGDLSQAPAAQMSDDDLKATTTGT
jgi:GAF domain-containing protein